LIEAHEKEIAEWNSEELGRKITLMDGLTIWIWSIFISIVHSNQISET
jgi:hypothetical protein